MKQVLPKKYLFIFLIVLFFSFVTKGNAQCSIVASRNTTGLSCGTSPLSTCGGVLYIGDGTNAMTLTIDSGFDLSCLGAINFVVRNNATILFGNGANDRITLAEGSTITVNSGAQIDGGNQCTASDRIYIGGLLVSTCNGQANSNSSFDDLETLGGTGSVTSNSPVCVGNTISLTATPPPNGTFTYSWTGPNSFTSSSQTPTLTATSSSGGEYNVVMTRTSDSKKAYGRLTVTVNSLPTVAAIGGGATSVCVNSSTSAFTDSTSGGTWSITNGTGTASITTGGVVTGLTAGNVTVVYTVSNGTCSNTVTKSLTVNSLPTQPNLSIITQPTCSVTTGSFTILNYDPSYSYTITPSTGVARTGANVTALAGNYTISSTNSGCTSSAANFTINAQPSAPTQPSLSAVTQPTCSVATGSFTISNYNASYTYSVTPSTGVSISSNTVTAPAGSYTVTATLGSCTSVASNSVVVNAQPATPVQPTLGLVTQPTCSTSTGSFTISNYNTSYNYSATPSTGVVISGSTVTAPEGSYTITASSGSCISLASNSVTVNVQPATPVQPTLSAVIQPTCNVATGNFTISNYNASYTYSVTPSTGVSISSNIVTAPAGSYTVTATLGSCTSVASNSVVVNAQPATPVQPTLDVVTQPTCSASTGSFTISNYNASYNYSVTPSTGVVISGSTVTAPAGSYIVTATLGSCTSVASNSVTVNAQPLTPSIPIAGTPTNPTCTVPTGSVPLSGLPNSGTITRTGSYSDFSYTITGGGSQVITGLLPGTYSFAVSDGSCTSATVNVVITAPTTNTWSTGSWSNGTPTINQRLVFASDYSNLNDVDVQGCSCQVTGTVVVTIKSGRTLKIENGVDVASTASLNFENNASLVQINDAAINTGVINYHRYTAPVRRYDFTYWSSPVVGQTLKNLSPNTLYDKYYSYNPNTGWVISYNGVATMVAGNGYLVRAPQTFSITASAIDSSPVFIGKPNNGVVTLSSLAGNKVHLLGNPYPSAINADTFLDLNSAVLEGTLYFWTHNTPPSNAIAGDATYNYTTNDYATYNRTGGVSTGTAATTGKIAAGQGFFAPTKATGDVVFNNSMRLSSVGAILNNSQFFKLNTTSKTSTATTTEKSRIWLNLTNKEGAYKQILVGYITGATNNYDAGYDGVSYDGNQYVDFYSVNNAVNLSIQGRALPFEKKDSIALGYRSTIKGEFQISIDHADGELSSQTVFLEDTMLKVLHDLRKEPYTFSTEVGRFDGRFVLRYVDKNAVEPVVDTPQLDQTVLVSVNSNEINVSSKEDLISKIIIYDISGKIIYQKEDVAANDFMVQYLLSSQQVLFVNVILANGKTTSTKIIY